MGTIGQNLPAVFMHGQFCSLHIAVVPSFLTFLDTVAF